MRKNEISRVKERQSKSPMRNFLKWMGIEARKTQTIIVVTTFVKSTTFAPANVLATL